MPFSLPQYYTTEYHFDFHYFKSTNIFSLARLVHYWPLYGTESFVKYFLSRILEWKGNPSRKVVKMGLRSKCCCCWPTQYCRGLPLLLRILLVTAPGVKTFVTSRSSRLTFVVTWEDVLSQLWHLLSNNKETRKAYWWPTFPVVLLSISMSLTFIDLEIITM